MAPLLCAYAASRNQPVVCFAHVTNTTATDGADFGKRACNGAYDALAVVRAKAAALTQPLFEEFRNAPDWNFLRRKPSISVGG